MGTVILADVTELETIKISELTEATEAADTDVVPIVKTVGTKKITTPNMTKNIDIDGGTF